MAQEIFRRVEKKYMLNREQYNRLMEELSRWMDADDYGQHRISNIYFDTPDYKLIRESIEKPVYKEKVRMRGYGTLTDDSTVFLELKKKFDGIVYKRRVSMKLSDAKAYLEDGTMPDVNRQIMQEIDYTFKRYRLQPKAFVAYDRVAYAGKDNPDLRVTFDRFISCRDQKLDLAQKGPDVLLIGEDQILMEVKIPGAMPLWMSRIFAECKIYPVSYSKYGTYYKEHLYENVEKKASMAVGRAQMREGVLRYA